MTESSGERFLKENQLIQRTSTQRQQLLACIACRWNKAEVSGDDPAVYGYQIIACTGMKSGVVYPLLSQLEEIGVTDVQAEELEESEYGRPPRRYIRPSNTALGEAFARSLTPPEDCQLDNPSTEADA